MADEKVFSLEASARVSLEILRGSPSVAVDHLKFGRIEERLQKLAGCVLDDGMKDGKYLSPIRVPKAWITDRTKKWLQEAGAVATVSDASNEASISWD